MAKVKYPTPDTCKLKERSVLCTAERVLKLYNQETGEDAKRIAKTVKKWFLAQLPQHGWSGGIFLPEVQTGHGAGCVLFIRPQQINLSVKVSNTTLVLHAESGDED